MNGHTACIGSAFPTAGVPLRLERPLSWNVTTARSHGIDGAPEPPYPVGCMARVDRMVGSSLQMFARVGSERDRDALRHEAQRKSIEEWKRLAKTKVAAVSALTSWPGGLAAPAAVLFDLAFMMRQAGRACFGIGHILQRHVDYDSDMPLILAIWADAAKATSVAAGMATVVLGRKVGAAASAGAAVMTVLSKDALKNQRAIVRQVIVQRAVTKLATNAVTRTGLGRLVPLISAGVAAAASAALLDAIMAAAEKYYASPYVVLEDEELAHLARRRGHQQARRAPPPRRGSRTPRGSRRSRS